MNRLTALSLAAISCAVLLLTKKPTAQAANKLGDFSFCVVASHGRCFTLKNDRLKSDSNDLKLNQEQLKKIASELQDFF